MSDETKPHILIIHSPYYGEIADHLLAGAKACLEEAGATHEVVDVPGALEIPIALALAVEAGLLPYGARYWRYHGAVALGCVIRGETSHYDIVAGESARSFLDIAAKFHIPIGNGILTVENREQALTRARQDGGNKGAHAVKACLSLIDLRDKFRDL